MSIPELKHNQMDAINSKKSKHKETRWNRIRKKHLNSLTVTTNTVKKFINMNFVHENDIQMMSNPDGLRRQLLNPVVVMKLRHEMIRNKFISDERKGETPTKDLWKAARDNEYIDREEQRQKILIELNKFRKQMNTRSKSRMGSSKKSHLLINLPTKLDYIDQVTENEEVEKINGVLTKVNKETDLKTEDYINKFFSEVVEVSPNERSRHTTTPQGESLDEECVPC